MDSFLHLILPLLSFAFFFFIIIQKWHGTPQKNLPPSPKKLPIIGNLHQIGTFPHRTFRTLSSKYGPFMLLHFGRVPVLIASSPDAAREIMKNQDQIFSNRPKMNIPDRLTYGSRDVAFAPYGEYWRQVRGLSVVHLLSSKRVQSFRSVREEETSYMVDKIGQMASTSAVVNLSELFVVLTYDIVCRVALGKKYGDDREGRRFKKFLREFVYLVGIFTIGEYIPWLSWIDRFNGTHSKVENVARLFDEFLVDVLEDHRRKKEHALDDSFCPDFVDIILEFQRNNKVDFAVDDDTIKAIILDVFVAGTDTTFTALGWTMSELLRSPRTMKKLQAEVRKVSQGKKEVTEDDLEQIPYLKAIIKESLRLHPPVPLLVLRESTQDTKVMGYDIAAGTRVMINAWAIGRDPTLWESPEEFCPERFLDVSTDFRGLHFELIPFGAGRRGCPGIAFALTVTELALAKLVQRFDFSLSDGGKAVDLDMSESPGIVVQRKSPLFVAVTPHV